MRISPSCAVWTASALGWVSLSECAYKAPTSGVIVAPFVCRVTLQAMDYDISNIFASSKTGDEPPSYFMTCNLVDNDGSVGDHLYTLNGLSDHLANYHERIRGNEPLFVSISEATTTSTSIQVDDLNAVQVVESPLNYTHVGVNSVGNKTALVVRVSVGDSMPNQTVDELYEYIFSSGLSLSNQMNACSFGALSIRPTEYGVMDIQLASEFYLQDSLSVLNEATVQVLSRVQEKVASIEDLADFLVFVLPPGANRAWKSWATFKGKMLVFNDAWGSKISALSHAVGHSFGLDHANKDGIECADSTGYMGLSLNRINFPARCFNAYNMWLLGWVRGRSLDVDPSSPGLYKVISIADYANAAPGDEFVVLRIGNLFMLYNGAKGFNANTGEHQNKLVLVNAYQWETNLLGGLDLNQPFFRQQINDTSSLVVQICSEHSGNDTSAAAFVVSVGYDLSLCYNDTGKGSPQLSNSPSPSPQMLQTLAPSIMYAATSLPSPYFDKPSSSPFWNVSIDKGPVDGDASSTQSSAQPAHASKQVWIATAVLAFMLLILVLFLGVQLIRGKALARYRKIGSLLSIDGSSRKYDCAESSFTSASTRVFSNVSLERSFRTAKQRRPPESVQFSNEEMTSTTLPVRYGDPCDEPPLKRVRRDWFLEEGLWGASEI